MVQLYIDSQLIDSGLLVVSCKLVFKK